MFKRRKLPPTVTVKREDFERKTVTCRFCGNEQDVMRYTGQPTLPMHRQANGMACDGSGATLEHAVAGYATEQIKLKPELGNSQIKNFYEQDDDSKDFGW